MTTQEKIQELEALYENWKSECRNELLPDMETVADQMKQTMRKLKAQAEQERWPEVEAGKTVARIEQGLGGHYWGYIVEPDGTRKRSVSHFVKREQLVHDLTDAGMEIRS